MASPELEGCVRRLHEHMQRRHWDGGVLVGSDVGLRWRFRVLRFVNGYVPALPAPRHVFLQAQGYWIRANWRLHERTGDERFRSLALACTEGILARQEEGGSWRYPLPEWRHHRATVEGCFGAIGLIESFRRTAELRYLAGAHRWFRFMVDRIGFQSWRGTLAVNYFDTPRANIPNNTVDALWLVEEMFAATGDERYHAQRDGMLAFLALSQLDSGELPYAVESPFEPRKEHYLCFQYNAFQFVKLARCFELTRDQRYLRLITPLARFLTGGIDEEGFCRADCFRTRPHVPYWTAALAEALMVASDLRLADAADAAAALYGRVTSMQRRDGGFDFSLHDAGNLTDHGSYPRAQSMILDSLLERLERNDTTHRLSTPGVS